MVFLKNKETNETKESYSNVIDWGENFVEYTQNGARIKIYCGEDEYFTDEITEEE